jgi:hypothetical protein
MQHCKLASFNQSRMQRRKRLRERAMLSDTSSRSKGRHAFPEVSSKTPRPTRVIAYSKALR